MKGDAKPTNREINDAKLVTDKIIAEVTAAMPKPERGYDDIVIEKANDITVRVRRQFMFRHEVAITPMKKKDAVMHINKMYLDEYRDWPKEDLLILLCLIQAALGAESLHEHLI